MARCADCSPEEEHSPAPEGAIVVALAGNPNTGKSSIFNLLTGGNQHIGNWPGKTVSKAHGSFTRHDAEIQLVDLPGTYSLNAASPEEMIARDYLVHDRPDAVIVVADASNLERNLYLVVQVLEIGLPTVVALNMSDVARSRSIDIDVKGLAERLEAPVVSTVARKGQGLDDLTDAVLHLASLGSVT
ncbi:MAG: FeoB small GTPase domain-containing protein [Actinomycetota bacterium]